MVSHIVAPNTAFKVFMIPLLVVLLLELGGALHKECILAAE